MKQLITSIVQALVDKPDEVQIKEVIGEHAHVLELTVAKEVRIRNEQIILRRYWALSLTQLR